MSARIPNSASILTATLRFTTEASSVETIYNDDDDYYYHQYD